jgi:hypothetical protein
MILVSKNGSIPVHQTVELSDKCKFCWEASSISHRKSDALGGLAIRDWPSLAVGALGNTGTRGESLLANGQSRREQHGVNHVRSEGPIRIR